MLILLILLALLALVAWAIVKVRRWIHEGRCVYEHFCASLERGRSCSS